MATNDGAIYRGIHPKTDDIITVREARHDDYNDVMEASVGVYDGNDYLPVEYHRQVQDPKTTGYVIEVNGKVVGYRGVKFLDDQNTTALSISARVDTRYQGQGLLPILNEHSQMHFFRRYPKVKRSVWTALYMPLYINRIEEHKGKRYGIKLLDKWKYRIFTISKTKLAAAGVTPATVHTVTPDVNLQSAQLMSTQEALDCYESGELRRFVNVDYLVMGNGWKVYSWQPSGVRDALQQNELFVTRDEAHPKRPLRALSYSHGMRSPAGLSYLINFKGSQVSDFKAHVVGQLLRVYGKLANDMPGMFYVMFPWQLDENECVTFVRNLLGRELNSDVTWMHDGGLYTADVNPEVVKKAKL